jgi:DNA-binding CsgD family transcriptional regulator
VITADTKLKVKQLVAAKKTGQEISKALKISLPSVQNIKKALGLVKARR